ncbi:MAG: cytochrome c3 family protein [Gemmatimonadetes bacterium]|nr:cytochrome c3 family protein [Gemmatimonadota bacterium]
MRKRFFRGLGAAVAVMGAMALLTPLGAQKAAPPTIEALTDSDSAGFKGPSNRSSSDDVHAGMLKMQCQYCHYSANVSSEPGIPSMQTCMGCHIAVSGKTKENKVEIQKLKDAWSKKLPVEWTRVHELARHVHFPHQRHIKALGANACATCHGNVARMPQVYKVNNVNNMGFCISCHIERKVSRDCTVCHY